MSSSTEDDLQKVLGLPSSDPSANQAEYPHESLDKQMADYYRYEYTKTVYDLRIQLSWASFLLVIIWLLADLAIIFFSGIQALSNQFIYTIVFTIAGINVGIVLGYILTCIIGKFGKKRIPIPFLTASILAVLSGYYGHQYAASLSLIPFHLSDAVLITMITTTTASVIGILLMVMKWLFPAKDIK